ncbi:MAG: hypothetical protein IPN08_08970 [Bacteroidales bacterium]|nr:hypothetical protein [Bacteroidales bacterium]
MKTSKLLLYKVLAGSLIFTSCKKDEEETINESQVLVEYMESANSPLGKDYVSSDLPTI